jgi:ABC-type phosphate transport system substrate-binding protein
VRTSTGKEQVRILSTRFSRRRLGAVTALVSVCIVAALLLAPGGGATVPTGSMCNSAAKISGRGATFQWFAEFNWMQAFRDDNCGAVTDAALNGSSTGDTMVLYNGTNGDVAQVSGNQGAWLGSLSGDSENPVANNTAGFNQGKLTGSGAGITSQECRTDAFAGSDKPYNQTDLTNMRGAPGSGGCTAVTGSDPSGAQVNPFTPTGTPFPGAGDVTSPILSFPVAVSAVALGINFTAAGSNATCRNANNYHFSANQVSKLMGGDFLTWDQVIPGCLTPGGTAIPIKRVVRSDNSGTSQIMLNFLGDVDGTAGTNRAGANCESPSNPNPVSVTWNKAQPKPPGPHLWPGDDETTPTASCSQIVHGWKSGNPGVIDVCDGAHQPSSAGHTSSEYAQFDESDGAFDSNGAVCYADLPDLKIAQAAGQAPNLRLASVATANNSSIFASAANGQAANCDTSAISRPGTGNGADLVGLNATDTWASDNTGVVHSDITDKGSKYPICGPTFMLVYPLGTTPTANSRLTAAQIRTLYAYVNFIESSAGQNLLNSNFYASMPLGLYTDIRSAFQANF